MGAAGKSIWEISVKTRPLFRDPYFADPYSAILRSLGAAPTALTGKQIDSFSEHFGNCAD